MQIVMQIVKLVGLALAGFWGSGVAIPIAETEQPTAELTPQVDAPGVIL